MTSISEYYVNDPDPICHKYDNAGNYLDPNKVLNVTLDTNQKIHQLFITVKQQLDMDFLDIIDKKQTGQLIGSIFVVGMEKFIDEMSRTPSPTGHPDLIPHEYAINPETREHGFFDQFQYGGVEVKTSIGSLKPGASSKLKTGDPRISHLTSIEWKGHHRKINNLLGLFWDYDSRTNTPIIISGLYSNQLIPGDFTYTDQKPEGGNTTNVAITKKTAKIKMGRGWLFCKKQKEYSDFIRKVFEIVSFD